MSSYPSWGRYPKRPQTALGLGFRDDIARALQTLPAGGLVYGNGRSYGDSCLAANSQIIPARKLDRFIAFDRASGQITVEAGVLLAEIIELALPAGWFLPATPGTRFVTVGGAIANDVHGKNHHLYGTFGEHVLAFELVRSDGTRRQCLPGDEWFQATVGGLGLTGCIAWATLQLRPVAGPWLGAESIKFDGLADFFTLSEDSAADWEYTVAWVDCLASGKALGRGHFMRAQHVGPLVSGTAPSGKGKSIPFTPPISMVNGLSLRAFNALYYNRQLPRVKASIQHYQPFFYPLDAIANWNRMYGPRGFQQYQCVVPPQVGQEATAELLQCIGKHGMGSFLAVLKVFGDRPPVGLLSFPRPGATLALDFPEQGVKTARLFAELDKIVTDAGGAIYPAKDAHMSPEIFRSGYPNWNQLEAKRDPKLMSAFWQRVTQGN